MEKKELAEMAEITQYTMKKLNKNRSISTETIGKIYCVLDCTADDIMEFRQD